MENNTVNPSKVKGAGTKGAIIVATNPSPSSEKNELICSSKYEAITLDSSKGFSITKGGYKKNTPEIIAKRMAKMKDKGEEMSH